MIARDGARATTCSHMCQIYGAAVNSATAADTADARASYDVSDPCAALPARCCSK